MATGITWQPSAMARTLKMFVNSELVASTPIVSADPRLAVGTTTAATGMRWVVSWTRIYAGGHGDRAYGFIDEVRISDHAVDPHEFLFPYPNRPQPCFGFGAVAALARTQGLTTGSNVRCTPPPAPRVVPGSRLGGSGGVLSFTQFPSSSINVEGFPDEAKPHDLNSQFLENEQMSSGPVRHQWSSTVELGNHDSLRMTDGSEINIRGQQSHSSMHYAVSN